MEPSGDLPFLSFAAEPPPGVVAVCLDDLIAGEQGWLIYGGPGSGKSHELRSMAEQWAGRVHQIIIDTEGEFSTLREKYEFLLAGTDDAADVRLSVATAPILCQRIMELSVSTILDVSGMRLEERPKFVAAFLDQLVETPPALWHPLMLFVDEVQRYAPQKSGSVSRSAIVNAPGVGRKRGIMCVYATQNIEGVDKDAISYLPNRMVGLMSQDLRRERAADDFDLSGEERLLLKRMKRGEFFVQGPAFGNQSRLVRIPDTQTHKPPTGLSRVAAPSAPDAIKRLLDNFAELPQQAEEEAKTLAEAKARIGELEKQLKEKPRPQSDKPAAKPAPETVIKWRDRIVNVPVLDEAATDRLRATMDELKALGKQLASTLADAEKLVQENTPAPANDKPAALPVPALPIAPPRSAEDLAVAVAPDSTDYAPGHNSEPLPSTSLSRAHQSILDGLAALAAVGMTPTPRNVLAFWIDVSFKSSSFQNNLGALRSGNYIKYEEGKVALTVAGRLMANTAQTVPNRAELQQRVLARLSRPQAAILTQLIAAYPSALPRATVAVRVGASVKSSSFQNNLSELRSLTVLDYPDGGTVRATAVLFPDI